MLNRVRVLGLTAVLTCVSAAPAQADWLFAPLIGLTFQGNTTIVDLEEGAQRTHWTYGGSVTYVGEGPFGAEGLFLYTPGFFESSDLPVDEQILASSRTLALMGNVVLTTPRRWNEYGLRPYVSGGLGLMHVAQQDERDVFPISETSLGFNIGAGAVGFITERTGLRFDLRYFRMRSRDDVSGIALDEEVRLRYWNLSVGFVIKY